MAEATPIAPSPEPRRQKFKETSDLPDEPKSDVAIEAGGMTLRERVERINSPHGVSLVFTYTRLKNGKVMRNDSGEPLITDPHEVSLTAEDMVRVGEKGVAAGLQHGREVAVARAVDHFKGLEKLPGTLTRLLKKRI